ncbi:PAS domain-containing protein [Nisaea sediminum]|uniref:PAS domain-containing protein n=1 Tax=Nisaea sediminum TaxID=2775867 RepID=UPI001868C7C0|nr:PAS domain-containing protein [Nisaea sediminum]
MPSDAKAISELKKRIPQADGRIFDFFAAWLAARGDALVARRKTFSPLSVPSLLRYMWIYRFEEEAGDYVCNLAGESVNDAWGKGIKGRTLRNIIGEEDYPVVRERWDSITGVPLVQYGAVEERLSSLDAWHAERLLLPMSSEDGKTDVVLGISLYNLDYLTDDKSVNVSEVVMQFPCSDFL